MAQRNSQQVVHQNLIRLDAHMLSNYVVIPRAKAVEFRKRRDANARKRLADAATSLDPVRFAVAVYQTRPSQRGENGD